MNATAPVQRPFIDFNTGLMQTLLEAKPSSENLVASPTGILMLLSALLSLRQSQARTTDEIQNNLFRNVYGIGGCERDNYTDTEDEFCPIREAIVQSEGVDANHTMSYTHALLLTDTNLIESDIQKYLTMFPNGDFSSSSSSDMFSRMTELTINGIRRLMQLWFAGQYDVLNDFTLTLLNAISFKDHWHTQFYESQRPDRQFRLQNGTTVFVPFMKTLAELIYFESPTYKFISKHFKNERFSFVVVLPKEDRDISSVASDLQGEFAWNEVHNMANLRTVFLHLPRFKVEDVIDSRPLLERLGMKHLFDIRNANLTGLTAATQTVLLDVNKYGVGVDAANRTDGQCLPDPEWIPFVVDRPFYCAIYDTQLKMPHFVARIMDPR